MAVGHHTALWQGHTGRDGTGVRPHESTCQAGREALAHPAVGLHVATNNKTPSGNTQPATCQPLNGHRVVLAPPLLTHPATQSNKTADKQRHTCQAIDGYHVVLAPRRHVAPVGRPGAAVQAAVVALWGI